MDGPPKTRTIITPTGWDEATIREYAQYVITRDNQLSDHVTVRVKLEAAEPQPNLTTQWKVVYLVHHSRAMRRAVSIVTDESRSDTRD